MKQLSLLDLEPNSPEPKPRQELDWSLFGRLRFKRLIEKFLEEYGETPVFWRRVGLKVDIFQLSPNNHLVIDLETGQLTDPHSQLQFIWDPRPEHFKTERRRFLSSQVCAVLDGFQDPSSWQPEIMEEIRFDLEREELISGFLKQYGHLEYLHLGPHAKRIRLLGPPGLLKQAYLDGCAAGLFF